MRKALTISALIVVISALVLCAIMLRDANASPIQRSLTVELEALPAGTPPLRLVLMSDFHVARFGDTPERLRETVDRVDRLKPDVVLLAGDFLSSGALGSYGARPTVAAFSRLKPPLGKFAVLGNRDATFPKAVALALAEVDVRVLNNDAERAGPLAIVGVADAFSGKARLRPAMEAGKRVGGVPIVLTHSPDLIPRLPPEINLALAGHTHCGQIVLPLIGPIITDRRYRYRYLCGIVREGRRTTIVTSGLGVSRLPFRLGALPDFWVITLVPRKSR